MDIDPSVLINAWALARDIQLGLHEHYKGGRYSSLAILTHHETRMPMVLYVSHTYGGANVRPVVGWDGDPDGWLDVMTGPAGETIQRFRYIGPLPSDTPLADR